MILSLFTLRSVLTILLVLTVLTVASARAEVWIMDTFSIVLPAWVNVVVAMSIATVKAALVVMFFMQLRYDNPINAIIFLFTLLGVALFMGFTMIDLANRGRMDTIKVGQIQAGGSGSAHGLNRKAIADIARENYILQHGAEAYEAQKAEKSHGHHSAHEVVESSAQASRGRTGLTPGLYDESAPVAHDDSHGHTPASEEKHDAAPAKHGEPAPAETKPAAPAATGH